MLRHEIITFENESESFPGIGVGAEMHQDTAGRNVVLSQLCPKSLLSLSMVRGAL